MASIHVSYNQRHVIARKVLMFDKGVLRIDDTEKLYWNDALLVQPASNVIVDSHRMGGRDLSGFFRIQFAEFANAVQGLPHRCALHEEGRRHSAIIDRIRQAARESSRHSVD